MILHDLDEALILRARLREFALARIDGVIRGIRGGKVTGHVDEARHGVLYGWAWRSDKPGRRLSVDVFVDGCFVGQAHAHLYRQDLQEAGVGDGCHGFEILIGERLPADLAGVRAFALDERRVELAAPDSRADVQRIANLRQYLRITFEDLIPEGNSAGEKAAPQNRDPRWARLLTPASAQGPSKYVAHIAQREGLDGSDTAGTLLAYLAGYGRRRGRLRAPLSAQDVAHLNEGPTEAAPLAPGNAQQSFTRANVVSEFEASWLWAAYESAAWAGEDCLTPRLHRGVLASPERQGDFALSRAMRQHVSNTPFLARFNAASDEKRRLVWLWYLLLARVMPHMLDLIPADGLAHFTVPDANGRSPFDETLSKVFGATDYSVAHWRADISAAGYCLDRRSFASRTRRGDRIRSPSLSVPDESLIDVQLIGPFSRRLGISDSCHMLAAALQRTNFSLRLVDYVLDHPNAERNTAGLRLERPGRARVTILHLNLEDIPTAIAYLPDVFTETFLVALPYLELSAPGAVHSLGLELVDEIWGASRFIADALSPCAPTHYVGTACKPMQPIGREAARKLTLGEMVGADDYIFLTAGDALSGAHRKNPLGVIEAFRAAFPSDRNVRLVVKTHSRARIGAKAERDVWQAVGEATLADPRILLMDCTLSDSGMSALLQAADCLVSLHRAEGFGYHLIEAMKLKTPVVATGYSGNLDFCTPQTAFLVDHTLRAILPGEYPRVSGDQTWAEPDLESAVAALRAARHQVETRNAKIAAASALVEREFSLDAFASRVQARLATLLDTR